MAETSNWRPTDDQSEALLRRAKEADAGLLASAPVEELPHVAAWREAYRLFGAKPQRTRNSLEALTRRAPVGLPRVNRLTDIYNAISVLLVEHPDPGEVVWCDAAGVTCRRWNWRQGPRTQLTPHTTAAFFILDALAPMTDDDLIDAADDLVAHLRKLGPDVRSATRLIVRSRA